MLFRSQRKSCFVAKGFTQVFEIDYENTFSLVARFETLHLLLSLAVLHDLEIEALDVKTAFLFGKLNEEIYMEQPKDFVVKGKEKKVCRLRQSPWCPKAHELLLSTVYKYFVSTVTQQSRLWWDSQEMCGGLRCDRLIPKEGPKQVSDGLGERGEEEKVFTRGPKVGWTTGK